MRTWILARVTAFALAVVVCPSASAQSSATLTERIVEGIAKQEPAWHLEEPFAPPRGSIEPSARSQWKHADGSFTISVRVYVSPMEAETAVIQADSVSNSIRPYGPRTRQVSGYGNLGFRTASGPRIEVLFQKHNVLVKVSGVDGSPAQSSVDRAAWLVDAAITETVLVTECLNELLPDRRPAPRNADDRLFVAANSGCAPDVQAALDTGANPNAGNDRESSLFAAASHLHVDVVRTLLKAGADPNRVDALGPVTPMWALLRSPAACCSRRRPRSRLLADRFAIADALVAAGGDINARRDNGRTMFLDAMRDYYWNDREFLHGLLARGADARGRDKHGDSALMVLLHYSASPKDDRIPLLIEAGVDVNATDSHGRTALDLVRDRSTRNPRIDLSDLIRTLIAAGAK